METGYIWIADWAEGGRCRGVLGRKATSECGVRREDLDRERQEGR